MSQAVLPSGSLDQIRSQGELGKEVWAPEKDTQRLQSSVVSGFPTKSAGNAGQNGHQESAQSAKSKAEKIQEGLEKTIRWVRRFAIHVMLG